jgi:hypothetical protein
MKRGGLAFFTVSVFVLVQNLALALPVVPGHTVQDYAIVEGSNPQEIAFDSSGVLYIGNDGSPPGQGLANIHRVLPQGPLPRTGQDYSYELADPDAVLVDTGLITEIPGSVLVGGAGHISAIYPDDQSIHQIWESSNPHEMLFDNSGRLLIMHPTGEVEVSSGAAPTTLINLPGSLECYGMTVDSSNRILLRCLDGTIRIYDSDGSLIDDSFVIGLEEEAVCGLTIGLGEANWGSDLYTISYGQLLRIDPSTGNISYIGSGFDSRYPDLEIRPDGALYISDWPNDKILIVPEPATFLLLGFGSLTLRRKYRV